MIALPADFSWIGPAAFEHCTRLQTVDISRTGIQEIVGGTFACCPQLQCLKLTKTLRRIGREAFLKCSSLAGQKLAMDRVAAGGGQASSAAAFPPRPRPIRYRQEEQDTRLGSLLHLVELEGQILYPVSRRRTCRNHRWRQLRQQVLRLLEREAAPGFKRFRFANGQCLTVPESWIPEDPSI